MVRRWIFGVSVVGALVLLSNGAHADMPLSAADEAFQQGLAYYDAEKFTEALERFRASLALERRPKVWVNIIYCLMALDQEVDAIAEYDAFVAAEGKAMSPALHANLESYVSHLGRMLGFGFLAIDTSLPGVLYLDGKRLNELAPGIPRRVPAGKHLVRLEAPGMAPAEQSVDVQSGARTQIRLSPRRPVNFDLRIGFSGGGTTKREELVSSNPCSVYCFPSASLLVGARLTVPLRGAFVAEVGGDYLHARTSVSAEWPVGGGDTTRATSLFSLHAAVFHASAGINVTRGPFRVQWRLGGGFIAGQHKESVANFEEADEAAVAMFLGLVHGRVNWAVNYHRVWLGIGLEGWSTLVAAPIQQRVPAIRVQSESKWLLNGPENEERRPLGFVVLWVPDLNIGWSF